MTETGPVRCQSSTDTPLDKRVSSVGTVQPHLEVRIIDPGIQAIVPVGQPGEPCTRGETLAEDELRKLCHGQIAYCKVPRHIRFVTEFPITVTGKIRKFKIREAMKEPLGLKKDKTA